MMPYVLILPGQYKLLICNNREVKLSDLHKQIFLDDPHNLHKNE